MLLLILLSFQLLIGSRRAKEQGFITDRQTSLYWRQSLLFNKSWIKSHFFFPPFLCKRWLWAWRIFPCCHEIYWTSTWRNIHSPTLLMLALIYVIYFGNGMWLDVTEAWLSTSFKTHWTFKGQPSCSFPLPQEFMSQIGVASSAWILEKRQCIQ